MVRLNNNIEIPQIGVGTWTLCGETASQIVLRWIVQRGLIFTVMTFDVKDSKVLNYPPLIPSISRAKYQRICMLTSLPVFTPCI